MLDVSKYRVYTGYRMPLKKAWFCFLIFSIVPALWAQDKYALVIGNSNYTGITSLANPLNDANDMAAALAKLGFSVDKVLDGDMERMESAIQGLCRRLGASQGSFGFFFYAGHGVQSNGENYLIPVNAAGIQSESGLRLRSVSVQALLDDLSGAGNELNIIVLDACRDNPFGWNRGGSRGLTMARAPAGSIVMYATSVNGVASDGIGRNGLFTTQLLKNLETPGLAVQDVFNRTGQDVINASGGQQHPEISVRFFGTAYLGSRPGAALFPMPGTPSTAAHDTAAAISAPQPVYGNMMRIEGGVFMMGSESGDNEERPVHQVTVESFLMGRYEVTQAEWESVMGNNPSGFKGAELPVENVSWFDAVEYCNALSQKEGLTPCYSGSGNDITCNWDANGYRLPTEAEWEYAAKGGSRNPFANAYLGNNNPDAEAWYNRNSGGKTQNVGTREPNNLGLCDMSGNVWEWCWDWYGS